MATRKKYEPQPGELELSRVEQQEALSKAIKAAVAGMPCQLDVDGIVQHAMRVLRSEQSNALWIMLGMEDKWGKWEFDNCNGRKGVIEKWIESNCTAELSRFLQEQLGEVLEARKAQFKAEIRGVLLKEVHAMISNITKVPWETRRTFEGVQLEMIKEVVNERKEEIRAEVLKAMSIDPAKYKSVKPREW